MRTQQQQQQQQLTATTSDGTSLTYRVYSGAGAARFALTHSLAMASDFWDRVVEHLLPAGDVLVYDCRGHGASGKPNGPYTVELLASDLACVLDAAHWPHAVIAGASMGGSISLAFAADYPGRTAALGLIDTTAWYGPDAPAKWEVRAEKAIKNGLAGMAEFQLQRWFTDAFREKSSEVVERALTTFLANDLSAYAEACRMLGRCDMRGILPHVRCPAVVMVGAEDYATPVTMAQTLADEIPNAELHVLDGARHLTPVEFPARIARELTQLAACAHV